MYVKRITQSCDGAMADGTRLAAAMGNLVLVHDANTGRVLLTLEAHEVQYL